MLAVQGCQSGQQGALLETRGPTGPGTPTLSTAPEPEEQDSPRRRTGYTRPVVKTSTRSHTDHTPILDPVLAVSHLGPPLLWVRALGPGELQEPPRATTREAATKGLLGAGHRPRRQSRGPRRQSPA